MLVGSGGLTPKRVVLAVALGLLFSLAAVAAAAGDPLAERLEEDLSRLHELGLFRGTVLVARGDRVVLAVGFGMADREKKELFTATTISSIGSITKQFTAAAIVELEEAGSLSVSDQLGAHFQNLPPEKSEITLHQLLTHSSGLPDALGPDEEWIGREALLGEAWKAELLFAPGTAYEYSNVGYSVLAAIVEKTSKKGYEEYLRQRFFVPLGMKDTGYVLPDWDLGRVARGYRGDEDWGTILEKQDPEKGFSWHLVGNGGMHSTAGDMFRWFKALRRNQVLSEGSTSKLFGRHVDEGSGDSYYGYGWVTFDLPGGGVRVGHNGGNGYLFEDLNFFPESELFYYLMVNDQVAFAGVSDYLSSVLAGSEESPVRPLVLHPLAEENLRGWEGDYQVSSVGTFRLEARPPGLLLLPSSSRVHDALLGGDPEGRRELAARSTRTGDILKGVLAGDLALLQQAYGGEPSLEVLKEVYGERLRVWQEEHGAVRRWVVDGSERTPNGFLTQARVELENHTLSMCYHWEGDRLLGWSPGQRDEGIRLYPVSDQSFESYSLGQSSRVAISRVKGPEAGEHLVVGSGENALSVHRLARKPPSRDPATKGAGG